LGIFCQFRFAKRLFENRVFIPYGENMAKVRGKEALTTSKVRKQIKEAHSEQVTEKVLKWYQK
jgi:hypothetical protein